MRRAGYQGIEMAREHGSVLALVLVLLLTFAPQASAAPAIEATDFFLTASDTQAGASPSSALIALST